MKQYDAVLYVLAIHIMKILAVVNVLWILLIQTIETNHLLLAQEKSKYTD
ncbi:GNAT family N-acetyltransferase, partial [Listeria monocytogenes]